MKITVDHTMKDLTPEEIEELKNKPFKTNKDDPEGFRKAMLEAKEVRVSPQVEAKLKELGISIDEVVAAMLKDANASN